MDTASHAPLPVKLVLLVVILPLALALAGGWQFSRVQGITELLAKIDRSIAAVERIQQEAGTPDVVLATPDGKKIPAATVLLRNRALKTQVLENTWWERNICPPLAVGAVLSGLIGAVIGIFGLFTVRRAGKRALRSRDALLQGFQDGLRKLPWLLGAMGLFIALAIALAGAFELVHFADGGIHGRGAVKLLAFGVMAIGALLYFCGKLVWSIYTTSKAVFERDPLRLMGKSVTREEAPLVWDFVKSIAGRAGAAMPETIILGLDEGFFVTEHPMALMSGAPVPAGRVLYLALPYMAYMTRHETEAVIGHELGHFTGADTEYSLRFAPIYATAVNNLRAVDAAADDDGGFVGMVAKPAMMFGIYYLDSFDLAVQHWSREREFAADATGAHIAGNEAVALSLLRISVLAPHVHQALGECWARGGRLEGGVLNRVRALVREHGLGDPAEHLEEKQAHPTDSHPATSQRLEAVNIPVTPELLARARNAQESTLLGELGLEGGGAPDAGGSIMDAASGAPCDAPGGGAFPRTGLSAALEAEFSQAARVSADGMEEDLREAALLGLDRVTFYENANWGAKGLAISGGMLLIGVLAAQKNLIAGAGGIIMGLLGVWLFFYFRKRTKKPFMTVTDEGLLAGAAELEVPWQVVRDYDITTWSRSSVEIIVDLAEGFTLPAKTGDRRVKFKPKRHRLHIGVQGIAKPHELKGFAEEFHNHWRGAIARGVAVSVSGPPPAAPWRRAPLCPCGCIPRPCKGFRRPPWSGGPPRPSRHTRCWTWGNARAACWAASCPRR
ncbi:putative Peptidase, M48 family [uncultured delta proteobacterium]|uniref:Putative Peptidase, M48 family n=1 Tax=uncultured delta proteobacterium TaxID=34034 RepID=A0A212ITL2_9DELT|nr:putative Peptidase, M48 family [uncultured delta proteobacterium]